MSGGLVEESFLETPTSILAVVFLCLQAMCIIFQFIVNSLKRFLRSKNRLGMITALDHSVWELTLVGFISLCLIALQSQITSICVTASPARSSWSIIHRMYGPNNCHCCLKDTQYTQQCILEYSGCGNPLDPFCNCNSQNATCVSPYTVENANSTEVITGYEGTGEGVTVPTGEIGENEVFIAPSPEGLRRLLGGGGGGGGEALSDANSSATLKQYCLEDVTVPKSTCPPGQMPVVSFLALEQVHLLIFTIAVVHVFLGFLLYLAASARLWLQWRRWNHRDDPHTILVRDKLEEYYASLKDNTNSTNIILNSTALTNTGNGIYGTAGAGTGGGDNHNSNVNVLPRSPFASPTLSRQTTKERSTTTSFNKRSTSSKFASVAAAVLEAAGIDLEAGRQDPRSLSNASSLNIPTPAGEGASPAAAAVVLPPLSENNNRRMQSKGRFSLLKTKLSTLHSAGSAPLPDILIDGQAYHGGINTKKNQKQFLRCCGSGGGDQNIIQKIWEYLTCFLFGMSPIGVVDHETYSIMRASYIYTHKLSTQFAFLDHVQRNLEDDLAHIVGLSAEFWIIIVLFILSSGPFGYAVTPFMGTVAFILCITNAKLVEITRKVTRRGGIGRLTSSIFWFNRPQLLLIPIKLVLFFCAFIYASFIFFAWQFGDGSCPFKDGFYTGWVLPWYTILIVNTIVFLHMAIVTLPTYSLCVLMGSDLKAHMLPKKFAKKLLAVATAAKEKVKADKEAAALASGSGNIDNLNNNTSGGASGGGGGGGGGFLNGLTVGRKASHYTTESTEFSKEDPNSPLKEENSTPGAITTPTTADTTAIAAVPDVSGEGGVEDGGPSGPTAADIAAAAAAARSTMAPARSAAADSGMDNVRKESRLDKAVSFVTRRLVGEKEH